MGQENLPTKRCGKDYGSLLVVDQMLVGIKFHHSFGEYESKVNFEIINTFLFLLFEIFFNSLAS